MHETVHLFQQERKFINFEFFTEHVRTVVPTSPRPTTPSSPPGSHSPRSHFQYTLSPESDFSKVSLNLPIPVPVFKLAYVLDSKLHYINVYPTVQFLYSHHIQQEYITPEVKQIAGSSHPEVSSLYAGFLAAIEQIKDQGEPPANAALFALTTYLFQMRAQ